MSLFIVKRAARQAAKPNKFRRDQKSKRGRWVTMFKSADWDEAWKRLESLCKGGGLYDVAIFYKDKMIADKDRFGRPRTIYYVGDARHPELGPDFSQGEQP